MKQWTIRIAICLLLGAVTTVAVAWGLASITDVPSLTRQEGTLWDMPGQSTPANLQWSSLSDMGYELDGFLRIKKHDAPGVTSIDVILGMYFNWPEIPASHHSPLESVPSWCRQRIMESYTFTVERAGERDAITMAAFGWPARALWCEPAQTGLFTNTPARGGIAMGNDSDVRTLPYRPIPLGILINTIFYACIWVILLVLFRIATQTRRNKRGHCPYCNYDLRNKLDRGCPECGWRRAT